MSVCYERPELSTILRESCAMFGVPLIFCEAPELGGKWTGDFRVGKLRAVLRGARAVEDKYDLFMVLDGFDTLVRKPYSDIISRWQILGGPPLLLSAEKNCFPDPGVADRYPACDGPYRYINAGTWLAKTHYLFFALENMVSCQRFERECDDQRMWTQLFLDGSLPGAATDTQSRVFQTMWGATDEEVKSRDACVVHYNGGIWRNPDDHRYVEHWARTRESVR